MFIVGRVDGPRILQGTMVAAKSEEGKDSRPRQLLEGGGF